MSYNVDYLLASFTSAFNLRYYTDKLGWQARTGIKVIKWKEAWPDEAIHVKFCRQDMVRSSQGALCE